jgi:signal transduction histidine kinase
MLKLTKSIEVFFLESLLKISLTSILVVIMVDYGFNRFDVVRSLIVNGLVLFAIVSTFILHRKGFFTAAVLWIGFVIMAAMFYQSISSDSITTSSMAVVMVIGFGFSVLLRGNLPIVLHGITLTGMALVFFWLAVHPARYGQPDEDNIIVAGVTYGVLYSVIAYSSKLLKIRYDEVFTMLADKNRELADKASEIEAQNEELQQSQENLFELNNHLEQMVEERTNKVKEQNERLIRYAYTNAHHLRGPVARLLGLVQLSKMDTDLNYEFLFSRVQEQTLELDEVVKGINRELQV